MSMEEIKEVGVLGLGRFGAFVPDLVPDGVNVVGYDALSESTVPGVESVLFDEVVDVDVLVLAVPLSAYRQVLPEIAKRIKPETLVIDICSVKVVPEQYLDEFLGSHDNMLVTHPLFGPQSAKDSTEGHQLIVAAKKGERADAVLDYCKDGLKLKVSEMTSEEHDRIMGQIHVLTFFVARGLATMNLVDTPFETPSYEMIRNLVAFNGTHSDELFNTIQLGNPFGDTIRTELIKSLQAIDTQLKSSSLTEEE